MSGKNQESRYDPRFLSYIVQRNDGTLKMYRHFIV